MNKKRVIFLIVLALIILLVGASVYYFSFRDKAPEAGQAPEQTSGGVVAPGENIVVVNEKLKRISAGPAVSPAATADGERVVYAGKSGGIYELGFDGAGLKESKFVAQPNLFRVLWSPNRNEFVAFYDSAGERRLFYNNRKAGTTAPLEGVGAVAVARTGNTIAYHRAGGIQGENAIMTADLSGQNARTALNTRLADVRLEWAGENEIAVYTAPSGLAQSALWLLNASSQKMSSLLTNISGLTVRWDDAGERFLYSQTQNNGRALSLFVSNKAGSTKRLDIATLPEKCVFASDGKTAVCVAPKNTPDLIWPDDYYKRLYSAEEEVWSVDLSTENKKLLYAFEPGTSFDATELVLSPKGDTLVFLNRADGYLYSLSLK